MHPDPDDQYSCCTTTKRREPKDPSDKHFRISMFKSLWRIVGCAALPFSLVGAALFLIVAEVLGIVEEL